MFIVYVFLVVIYFSFSSSEKLLNTFMVISPLWTTWNLSQGSHTIFLRAFLRPRQAGDTYRHDIQRLVCPSAALPQLENTRCACTIKWTTMVLQGKPWHWDLSVQLSTSKRTISNKDTTSHTSGSRFRPPPPQRVLCFRDLSGFWSHFGPLLISLSPFLIPALKLQIHQ